MLKPEGSNVLPNIRPSWLVVGIKDKNNSNCVCALVRGRIHCNRDVITGIALSSSGTAYS
jgi:hypothetical protein